MVVLWEVFLNPLLYITYIYYYKETDIPLNRPNGAMRLKRIGLPREAVAVELLCGCMYQKTKGKNPRIATFAS
jgi:hypothetical protein